MGTTPGPRGLSHGGQDRADGQRWHAHRWERKSPRQRPWGSRSTSTRWTGAQTTFANIGGHRDVSATECPGDAFYPMLPEVRRNVAVLIAGS